MRPAKKLPVFEAANVAPALAKGSPYIRAAEAKPLFKIGDRVKVRNLHPEGHTRLPGYLRGETGEIVLYHKAHVFPDSNAQVQEKIRSISIPCASRRAMSLA